MAEKQLGWHRYDMKKLRHCHPMYCDERACMSVCPLSYLEDHMSKLDEILYTC